MVARLGECRMPAMAAAAYGQTSLGTDCPPTLLTSFRPSTVKAKDIQNKRRQKNKCTMNHDHDDDVRLRHPPYP